MQVPAVDQTALAPETFLEIGRLPPGSAPVNPSPPGHGL